MQTIETSHAICVRPGFKPGAWRREGLATALPGEHNKEVLEDAGYTAAEIDTMLKEGVFGLIMVVEPAKLGVRDIGAYMIDEDPGDYPSPEFD